MRNIKTIEEEVTILKAEAMSIKSAQPFFNGQLDTNIIQSSNNYDSSCTVAYPYAKIKGYVRFRNQSRQVPFAKIVAVLKSNATDVLGINKCFQVVGVRQQALYNQGTTVSYEFEFRLNNVSQSTIFIKYYAITNDVAGEFLVYPGDWSSS